MTASLVSRSVPAPSLDGVLHLTFRERSGKTYLSEQYSQSPLKVIRPFDIGGGRMLIQIINTTAGIFGGDTYAIRVKVKSGAKVVLVTQSATKIFGSSHGNPSSERIELNVEDGGELEYYPGILIPFPDASHKQVLKADIATDAKFGFLELWAMGRVERGEYLKFRTISNRVSVYQDSVPVFKDALELNPGSGNLAGIGLLEGHRYVASGFWRWDTSLPASVLSTPETTIVTGRPAHGDLYLRGAGQEGIALKSALANIVAHQREEWNLQPLTLAPDYLRPALRFAR